MILIINTINIIIISIHVPYSWPYFWPYSAKAIKKSGAAILPKPLIQVVADAGKSTEFTRIGPGISNI